jgi:hypothetical protein
MEIKGESDQRISPGEKSMNHGKHLRASRLPHQLGVAPEIGPYIHINIEPVLLPIGPLALHWYGLMYVVAMSKGPCQCHSLLLVY